MSDDALEPFLGKMGAKGRKKAARYLGRVIAAANLAGARRKSRSTSFDGSRIGRGASMARVLSTSDRLSSSRARRVVVKTRLVRLSPKARAGAIAHLRYIQRDGVTRDGAPGDLYSARDEIVDGNQFLDRSGQDRHQFRFIVSPEDGDRMVDLKPFLRRLMIQMEKDLGTRLDWVAVDHFNTGHPHSHILLRGADESGDDLIIAREYISHGIRNRAIELATLDLGPRSDFEIEQNLRAEMTAERLTSIDRKLMRQADQMGLVRTIDADPFQQSLKAGRLQALERYGLASEIAQGTWRIEDGAERALQEMGRRGDIIRTMQHDLAIAQLQRSAVDRVIHEERPEQIIIGRLIKRGLSDELADRHYAIVDGLDGRVHFVPLGKAEAIDYMPQNAIVKIVPHDGGVRQVDRTIMEVATTSKGYYSVDAHLDFDANASEAFAETHVRRLEAMRRQSGSATKLEDGRWVIGQDHLEAVARHEARIMRDRPVKVELLSAVPFRDLPRAEGITWLDNGIAGHGMSIRDSGFGREAKAAMTARQQWLVDQRLAKGKGNSFSFLPGAANQLRRREMLRVAGQLSKELGLNFVEHKTGDAVEGIVKRRVDMTSGRFALVERSKEFSLVPWKPVLERHIGKRVSGRVTGSGISWSIGRGRSGPEIS